MRIRTKISFTTTQLECWLLVLLSAAYYILNMLFPYSENPDLDLEGRIFPQIAAAVIVLFCSAIIVFHIRPIIHNRYLSAFLALLVLALLYVFYPFKPIENLKYVSRVYFAVFYLLALFILLGKDRNSANNAIFTIYAFQLIFCIYSLVFDRVIYETGLSSITQFNSNSGFLITCCIPLALIIPRKRLRIYLYGLLVIASFFSGQRSAALVSLITIPLCLPHLLKHIKKTDILFLTIFVAAAIPVMIQSVNNISERNQYDIDKGEQIGSGRSIFWKMTWESYKEQNLEKKIFGNGTNSIAPVLETKYGIAIGAHNGWLDMLYTFGIIGFLLYAILVFGMLLRNRHFAFKKHPYKNYYLLLFAIFFVKCSTSHGYFDVNVAPLCAMIAILETSKIRPHRHAQN